MLATAAQTRLAGTAHPPERGDRHDWAAMPRTLAALTARFDLKTSASSS
jgi:hypothetical protein